MEQLFPEEGGKFTPVSDCSRQIVKEPGNVEAFELLDFSKKVRCEHCHKYMTSGHVYCQCGSSQVYANQNHVIDRKEVEYLDRTARKR